MIAIIIQARMGSTRLPGKIMLDLSGETVLWHVVERARKTKRADTVLVATTTNAEDDAIEAWCVARAIPVFRGSSEDVLARYYEAAQSLGADTVVRITSDCPLIDPEVIDRCIEVYQAGNYDYLSNCTNGPRTFPRGLDTEVFSFAALEKAQTEAKLAPEREHVTPYIWQNKKAAFKLGPALVAPPEYERPQYRLTLDYREDYVLIKHLYDALYRPGSIVSVPDVIVYLDAHPDIVALNAMCVQKTL
jgi:spore coat polysaccharide biosynthesis protein SpsF